MGLTVTENSKDLMRRLVRNAFDSINWINHWEHYKADELIKASIEYGLGDDFINELRNDKAA